jgi:predicted metal-dependent enzyme (double-stranded beta helix superfamily)
MKNHPSLKLNELVREIENRLSRHTHFINDHLIALIQKAGIGTEDLLEWQAYDHPVSESYGRRQVHQSEQLKVLVNTWNPGDHTAIHDHQPDDWGAVQFLGNMSHRHYNFNKQTLSLASSVEVKSGSIVGITGSFIHAMGNFTDQPVLTLHIYGTNTRFTNERMSRIFELEKGRVVLTDGSAFIDRTEDYTILEEKVICDAATLEDYRNLIRPFYLRKSGIIPF